MSTLSEPRRPRIFPQNRKLRHLKGLSLRNLTFAPTHLHTADDSLAGHSPHKNTKLEALRESAPLSHSRSSDSLRKDSLVAREGLRQDGLPPRPKQPQRRTSLSLGAQATPGARNKRLEEVVDSVVGDVFFSIHVGGDEEPIYVSEMRERATNFNFQFFELHNRGPSTSRSCHCTIRIWARRPKQDTWTFVLEELIDLRHLNFIGTLLNRRFPPNALIFHLEDGIYSLDFPNRIAEPRKAPPTGTSSYNALMRLANLESSIEDAIHTRDKIVHQINQILEHTPPDHSPAKQIEAKLGEKYVTAQQRANKQAERRREDLKQSIRYRRDAIVKGRKVQEKAAEDIANNREKLEAARVLVEKTVQQINGQRRRICSDLCDIFPITPIPNAPPLSFAICGIPLPNSKYDASTLKTINEDVLSAGLGLVALLTKNLQLYLSHHLPYPLLPYGSRSLARDDISHFTNSKSTGRDFPLFLPRGGSTSGQWRFEYAWFLLNKDIEVLCASQGLRVVDIQHTLPNLKYLLYVCSAGSEEVPERKKGGVRGLWAGKVRGRVLMVDGEGNGSRRGSVESDVSPMEANKLPFGEERFTLRTKGLRENVSS